MKFVVNKLSKKIPYTFAKLHQVCICEDADTHEVFLLYVNALNHLIVSAIKHKLMTNFQLAKIGNNMLDVLISEIYSNTNAASIVDDLQEEIDISNLLQNMPQTQDLLESQDDAPVIKIINAFLTQAVRENVSDIHLDAYEKKSLVRFRKDGTLKDGIDINPGLHSSLVSRIKIMAQIDIAEKRLPQDGRIALLVAGREIDLRVSTIPTEHGERVVLRLLDKNQEKLDLAKIGMNPRVLSNVDKLIRQPNGIFLVTGPTGSGKSTTLYSALSRLDRDSMNIMTVEDPVEYNIEGISQTKVNAKIDMTFAKALKAILRQDPDVIMIGEIRDFETAQIAVQSSLTGHLVFATLHTNSAVSTITRLIDMGIEPFLLSSTIIGILAQRLIRVLCNECKTKAVYDQSEVEIIYEQFGLDQTTKFYRPKGCEKCNMTGYKGRTGVYELLIVDDQIKKIIHDNNLSENEIAKFAHEKEVLYTLKDDAIRLIRLGMVTIDEVFSIVKSDNE